MLAGMARNPLPRYRPGEGAAACRPPLVVTELDPLELDGLQDDDGWSEREVRGSAVAADAERVAFSRSRIVGVRLTAANLRRLELTDVVLVDCELSNTVFEEATWTRVAFQRCRFSEADLGGAELTDVSFTDCQLDQAGLRMARAARLEVRGGSATGIDLYRARLAGSAWRDVDLTGAKVSGADLARAVLHGSVLDDLEGASALKGCRIDHQQVVPVGLALMADAGITVDDD